MTRLIALLIGIACLGGSVPAQGQGAAGPNGPALQTASLVITNARILRA